ncbi:hypothetical protein [Pseudomonas helleri]|uniref:hypothetical protein n=1 Tax=Pseudomonas helleri TaxID=1608996 RepID=UPI0030D8D0B0
MIGDEMDVGFTFDASYGEKSKFFNVDGSMAQHVNVWVEALDDKRFWMGYLRSNNDFKFFFKVPSEVVAEINTAADGCERLFHFEATGVIVLGVCQIFCLDGDDTYLKGFLPGFTSRKSHREFVYNTNIYAIENAFLNGDLIDGTIEAIVAQPLSPTNAYPSDFLVALSTLTFSLMTRMAFYEVATQDSESAISMRRSLRSSFRSLERADFSQGLVQCQVFTEFRQSVSDIEAIISVDLENLGLEAQYIEFERKVREAGICEENSYLFLKGHFVFDSAIKIYATLSNSYRMAEIERIRHVYRNSNAQAIDDQVRCIEKAWGSVGETLKHNFYSSRPHIPFFNEVCERLAFDYNQSV